MHNTKQMNNGNPPIQINNLISQGTQHLQEDRGVQEGRGGQEEASRVNGVTAETGNTLFCIDLVFIERRH